MNAPERITAMAETAMRPTIRDLMARKLIAENAMRSAHDAEWDEAANMDATAQEALMDRMADLTGLTRLELRELGGLLW